MSIQSIHKSKYRPEIDGLRAFAIIAVIINHFNKVILPNGYLGVDIFFVISGYVITSSLEGRKSKNFWDFITSFYVRRIKRLVPAVVFFVLITSLLICFFRLDPKGSLMTGVSSLFGLSNIALFSLSYDYFSETTILNPFTHTWSLGVEEQFYLLFPLIIWFTGFGQQTTKGKRNLFISVLFLIICSLISFIYFYEINKPAAYYLMPNRFWEMAVGCILFLAYQKKGVVFKKIESTSPTIVLVSIIGVMFLPISAALPSTILIVLLSALLIFCLREDKSLYKFLINKNIIHIGLISYSLYLWHWGVLSISQWTIGIYWWTVPFQILLIYLLSVTSYLLIENPLRKNDWSSKKWKTIIKGFCTLLISAISLISLQKILKDKLYLGDSKQEVKEGSNSFLMTKNCFDFSFKKEYIHQKVLNRCLTENLDSKQTLFFLGDSHSKSLLPAAEFIANKTNSNLLTFSYGGTTFPSIKYFLRPGNKSKLINRYRNMNSFEKNIISNFKSGDVVFITLRMPYHFGEDWYDFPVSTFRFYDENDKVVLRNSKREHFEQWLYAVKEFTNKLSEKQVKVVISTPTPQFPISRFKQCNYQNNQWFNKLSRKDCTFPLEFFTSKNGKYYHIIRRLNEVSSKQKNLYLFDSLNAMCPNLECKYSLDRKLLYIDDDHISDYTALNILAPEMLKFLDQNNILSSK